MTCEMKLHVFDPPSWICDLGFNFVLKSQEINLRKLTKYQARMLMECTNSWIAVIIIMKKTEKKNNRITSKRLILGQSYMQFNGCNGNIKNDGHTIDMSCQNFHREWRNSYWKFQPLSFLTRNDHQTYGLTWKGYG